MEKIMNELFGNANGKLLTKYFNIIIDYQKKNNISCQCLINTCFYIYCLNHINELIGNKQDINAIPVIALENNNNKLSKIYIHVVIKINDIIIDPSYETYLNVKYYENIDNIKNFLSLNMSKQEIKKHFIEFKEITDKINCGSYIVPDQKYFNDLSNYINTNHYKY